jgi:hypothetical protein
MLFEPGGSIISETSDYFEFALPFVGVNTGVGSLNRMPQFTETLAEKCQDCFHREPPSELTDVLYHKSRRSASKKMQNENVKFITVR